MFTLKSFFKSALVMAVAVGFTSCSDDDDEILVSFDNAAITMDSATSAWSAVYDNDAQLSYSGFKLSHSASVTEWAGVKYYSWNGFCPSVSADVEDRTEVGDWVDHQWGAITGKGMKAGRPYMLAMWDAWGEMSLEQPESPVLEISYTLGNKVFSPQSVAVTNSTWVYYALKNGSYPAKPFGENDYLYLYINGVRGGAKTGTVKVELAKGTDILNYWKKVDLTSLGEVSSIYFQLESSDANPTYGMNTPAYFCLDDFRVVVE